MILPYFGAFKIGIIAGMRAMMAPALVSHRLSTTHNGLPPDSKLHFMASPRTATITKVLAGGEIIGDKMPSSPDRTSPPQLGARVVSGAVSGATLSEADGQPVAWGAVLGGLGAVVGTFAFFQLRHYLTYEKGLPDPVVALAEDVLAVGLGLWIVTEVVPSHD